MPCPRHEDSTTRSSAPVLCGSFLRLAGRSLRWPASWGSARALWATGSARTAPGPPARRSTATSAPSWRGCASAAPSWRWGVMSSNDRWSFRSRRRRAEPHGAHRGPKDRSRCASRGGLPGPGGGPLDVLWAPRRPRRCRPARPTCAPTRRRSPTGPPPAAPSRGSCPTRRATPAPTAPPEPSPPRCNGAKTPYLLNVQMP